MNGEAPDALALASEVDTRKRVSWRLNYSDYATTYAVSDRAIKNWVRIGKKLGRLPPLDQPGLMAAWYAASMVERVPDNLLKFSKEADQLPVASKPRALDAAAPPPPDTPARDFSLVATMDLRQHVEKLRHNLAVNQVLLEEARASDDSNRITLCERNYSGSFELLRLGEQTLVKVQKERGEVIDRESVSAELSHACETLALMRQNMEPRVTVELEKILSRRLARILKALTPYLATAIGNVRASEEKILRDLNLIDGPEAVEKLLAA